MSLSRLRRATSACPIPPLMIKHNPNKHNPHWEMKTCLKSEFGIFFISFSFLQVMSLWSVQVSHYLVYESNRLVLLRERCDSLLFVCSSLSTLSARWQVLSQQIVQFCVQIYFSVWMFRLEGQSLILLERLGRAARNLSGRKAGFRIWELCGCVTSRKVEGKLTAENFGIVHLDKND